MVELIGATVEEPTTVFERAHGDVRIHEQRPRDTAVVRVEVPVSGLPQAIGEALVEIEHAMGEAAIEVVGPPFVRYHAFDAARIVAEVGCPVWKTPTATGRVAPGSLPGGRVASIVHIGPYERLADTYHVLEGWLAEHRERATGPMWEVYWSDPQAEPDPATWRTEILVPLD